ncbi:hypothetical protein HY612_04315 [Candidatus Roizmanbacteria bacterium]|nr:hypothetical protein [Candidatus Roizmanbacteria bacterium]
MLPIYPFLTILAGYGIYQISKLSFLPRNEVRGKLQQESIKKILWIPTFVGMTLAIIWTSIFLNIYSQKHTRIAATEWILQNIPKGSTLAVEHWDDRVPLTSGENYNYVEMTLYDQPDDELKWLKLNEILAQTDYIIIASNRLYVPLQKLSDCKKYKSCYPKTAEYYRKLFSGDSVILGRTPTLRRGTTPESLLDSGQDGYRTVTRQAGMTQVRFKKVAEFAVYPKLEIGNWKLEIRDDVADESFTVYDHPKILIFKKI